MKTHIFSIALAILLSGCCTPKEQKEITLENALSQVGSGLAKMRTAELKEMTNYNSGLFVSDVSVTFNVTASHNQGDQLTLDISAAVPQSPVTGKLSNAFSDTTAITRGNQITVNFASPLFSTTTTTTKQTNGVVETKVEKTVTNPTNLAAFYRVIYGDTNSVGVPPAYRPTQTIK